MILDFYSFYLVVAPFGPTERPAGLCFINKKYLDGTTRVGVLSAGKVCSLQAGKDHVEVVVPFGHPD